MDGARRVSSQRALRTLPVLSDRSLSDARISSVPRQPPVDHVCGSRCHVSAGRTQTPRAQRPGDLARLTVGDRIGDCADSRRCRPGPRQCQLARVLVFLCPTGPGPRGERTVSMGSPSDLPGGIDHDPGSDRCGTAGGASPRCDRRWGTTGDPDPRRRTLASFNISGIWQVCGCDSISASSTSLESGEAPGPERTGGRSLN